MVGEVLQIAEERIILRIPVEFEVKTTVQTIGHQLIRGFELRRIGTIHHDVIAIALLQAEHP